MKGALTKVLEGRIAQRKEGKGGPSLLYRIAAASAELGDKEQAFHWLNTADQERDSDLIALKTSPYLTLYAPTHDSLN